MSKCPHCGCTPPKPRKSKKGAHEFYRVETPLGVVVVGSYWGESYAAESAATRVHTLTGMMPSETKVVQRLEGDWYAVHSRTMDDMRATYGDRSEAVRLEMLERL